MKYVSLTFDDGRGDNYQFVFPTMKKYGLTGTLFCTTGYVDGTWEKDKTWYSAGEPLTVQEVIRLKEEGWEIGLHGDKHTTSVSDMQVANQKMKAWGIVQEKIGFSIPNSNVAKEDLDNFKAAYLGNAINYIRTGRRRSTRKITSKILFVLYTYLGMQWAYNRFNNINLNHIEQADKSNLYSVVVRCEDQSEMVQRFIEQMPDNAWVVLMFHSILPKEHELYKSDPWNWCVDDFEKLCEFLSGREDVVVKNVADIV